MNETDVRSVLDFWLGAGSERWFASDAAFDAEVRCRLFDAHEAAAAGRFDHWSEDRNGALALIILLDQTPRNMFRGTPRAFATDAKALDVAQAAVARGFDRDREIEARQWFYMPMMHAEDAAMQALSVALFESAGDETCIWHARTHRDVIARFGRFPHRNAIMGRETTPAEKAFLDGGGFSA